MEAWTIILLGSFVTEIFSLYFFSKLLTKSLAMIFYRLTGSRDTTIYCLAAIFLPGTLIHELAHALVAGGMLVPVGAISVTPKIHEGGVTLGTAEITKTDPFRRALIGVAPVIVGLALILTLVWFITSVPLWAQIVFGYIIFLVANTMFSSPKDLEGSVEVFAMVLGLLAAPLLVGLYTPEAFLQTVLTPQVIAILQRSIIFLFVPIFLDIFFYGLTKVIIHKMRR